MTALKELELRATGREITGMTQTQCPSHCWPRGSSLNAEFRRSLLGWVLGHSLFPLGQSKQLCSSSAHTALVSWESYQISGVGSKCQLLKSSHVSVAHVLFVATDSTVEWQFHPAVFVLVTHIPTLLRLLMTAHQTVPGETRLLIIPKPLCQKKKTGAKPYVQDAKP